MARPAIGSDRLGRVHGFVMGSVVTDESTPDVVMPLVARPGLDNVGIVMREVADGAAVAVDGGVLHAPGPVPAGHKIALCAISRGTPVRKYDETIGYATADIAAGEHVHLHNIGVLPDRLRRGDPAAIDAMGAPGRTDPDPLPRLSPRGRAGRDAQLHRCPADRQLFGDGGPPRRPSRHRRPTPTPRAWTV